jgi:hypothetical protein
MSDEIKFLSHHSLVEEEKEEEEEAATSSCFPIAHCNPMETKDEPQRTRSIAEENI